MGVDSVDVAACTAAGVPVANAGAANAISVAEWCVGATFALTEGTLIAAMLLQRFRFATAGAGPPRPSATVTLRPRGGLPMLVSPRA